MILEGRELPDDPGVGEDGDARHCGQAPCVFCGEWIRHVNDGGIGCVAGVHFGNDDVRHYLYCNEGGCVDTRVEDFWTCGDCQVDNLDGYCHECGGRKADYERYSEDEDMESTGAGRFVVFRHYANEFGGSLPEGWVRGESIAHVYNTRGAFHWFAVEFDTRDHAVAFAAEHDGKRFRTWDDCVEEADEASESMFMGVK